MALLGIYWMSLLFLLKYPLCLKYDLLLCITSLSWKSKNSETFSVSVSQFDLTDLTGTFDNLICVLGSKYILSKLVVFWYSYVQYLSSFSVILPWDFRLLNILLLLSTTSRKILSLKLTSWYIFLAPNYVSASTILSFLSQSTTQELLSAFLIIIMRSRAKILIAVHYLFVKFE